MELDGFELPEGATPIDPDEAAGLIPRITTQVELNEFEFLNISEAVVWAERNRRLKSSLLSPESLRTLHRKMFDKTWKWAGKFRLTQKSLGSEAYLISTDLKNLCEDAKVWIEHRAYPPTEIATRFHHRLVSIHPFPNGNGRHARLATDLLCESQGWAIPTWGSTDLARAGDARTRYITALRNADQHDIQFLLDFLYS